VENCKKGCFFILKPLEKGKITYLCNPFSTSKEFNSHEKNVSTINAQKKK